MPILGEPMVGRLLDRVLQAKSIDQVVIATTELSEDDPLVELAEARSVRCYRGDSADVLARIHAAMVAFGADPVVEILGDNPLIHSDLIDDVMASGRTKHWAISELGREGITVARVLVVVDREQDDRDKLGRLPCPMYSLYTITELIEYYNGTGRIDQATTHLALAHVNTRQSARAK